MKQRLLLSLACAATLVSASAQADMFGTAIGGGLGAVAGAVVGDSMGGRHGAIIGSGIGGAVGAVVGQQVSQGPSYPPPPRVYYPAPQVRYVPVQAVEYRYYQPPHRGQGWGHYKHSHRHHPHGYHD